MQAVLPAPRPRLKGAHVALCRPDKLLRRAVEAQPPLVEHQQAGAHRLHILDDVGGQEHQPVLGQPGKQVAEVNALLRVQSHRGLVKDQKRRIAQQGLGTPTRWRWPPERVRILARRFSPRWTASITARMLSRPLRSPFSAPM